MYTIKYKSLSGHWFETTCPDFSSANVIYEWKKTGGVCMAVEMHSENGIIEWWEKV